MPKPNLLVNLIEALCAIILGNVAYFFLEPPPFTCRATGLSRWIGDSLWTSGSAWLPTG